MNGQNCFQLRMCFNVLLKQGVAHGLLVAKETRRGKETQVVKRTVPGYLFIVNILPAMGPKWVGKHVESESILKH